uniref:Uncharacterized protein n=1 Tax=Anopheles dirus TaxID=7168 RepID=A0A182NYM5_9DIPT
MCMCAWMEDRPASPAADCTG